MSRPLFLIALLIIPYVITQDVEEDIQDVEKRITGGYSAKQGEFPYVGALYEITFDGYLPYVKCAVVIVNETHVLTAAHCCENMDPAKAFIAVGITNVCSLKTENIRKIDNYVIHPEYHAERILKFVINDLALIKLKTPITYSRFVQPARFIDPNQIRPIKVKIAGWGLTQYPPEKNQTDTLQVAEVLVTPSEKCNDLYPYIDDHTQFCILGEHFENACKGDSGGPVVHNNIVLGLISTGMGQCDHYSTLIMDLSSEEHRKFIFGR